MATTIMKDPGYGESFQAVANILNLAGQAEQARQRRQATSNILRAIASGDDTALESAMNEAANFTATNSGGLSGIMQRIGASQMTGASPGVEALGQVGLPMMQAKQSMAYNKARAKYYEQGGDKSAEEIAYSQLNPEERAKAARVKAGLAPKAGASNRAEIVGEILGWDRRIDEMEGQDLTPEQQQRLDLYKKYRKDAMGRYDSAGVQPQNPSPDAVDQSWQVPKNAAPGGVPQTIGVPDRRAPQAPAATPQPAASPKVVMLDPSGTEYEVDASEADEAQKNGWRLK